MSDAWGVTPVRRASIPLVFAAALLLPGVSAGQSLGLHTSGGLGSALSVPVETAPGLVGTPRLRRVRERWGLHTFLGLGAPLHIAPATLAGVEVSMGAWYDLYEELQVGGEFNADVFVAGDDLPEEGSVVMFNLVAGARVPL